MLFLTPIQQCQSAEGYTKLQNVHQNISLSTDWKTYGSSDSYSIIDFVKETYF